MVALLKGYLPLRLKRQVAVRHALGGLVVSRFGHLPKRGETIDHAGLRFQVIRADSRRIHSLLVERLPEADTTEQPAPAA